MNEEIARIADTHHDWRLPAVPAGRHGGKAGGYKDCRQKYEDVPGFCRAATLEEIRKHGHVLTPGRYVGAEAVEDDGEPFEEKMKRLTQWLEEQFAESVRLEAAIRQNLKDLGRDG